MRGGSFVASKTPPRRLLGLDPPSFGDGRRRLVFPSAARFRPENLPRFPGAAETREYLPYGSERNSLRREDTSLRDPEERIRPGFRRQDRCLFPRDQRRRAGPGKPGDHDCRAIRGQVTANARAEKTATTDDHDLLATENPAFAHCFLSSIKW